MGLHNIKTQYELAEKLGVTKNQVSVILSSNVSPFKSNFQKLCDALDVKPIDILIPKDKLKRNTEISEQVKTDFIDISNIKPLKKYNSVELFAGAGGLALGLEEAGFNPHAFVEIDKYAAETLRSNRPNWNVIQEDIVKVADIGIKNFIHKDIDIDLVSGGYLCQAFSYAGRKLGLEDVRGTMFYYFAQIVNELRPKIFLAENVKGLVSHDEGRTMKTMVEIYQGLGYRVEWHIVRANDYNVAQKRERVIIVGIRNDLKISYKLPKPFEYKPVLRDVLKDVPKSAGAQYPKKKREVLKLIPPGGYWRDLPEEIAREYMGKNYYSSGGRTGMARRISWDEPCLTLTCSPAQKQTERCHPDEVRPFTVREYARIQSFPDSWNFRGSVGEQYKQIGNAVPVQLAKAVGLSLIYALNQITED